MTPPDREMERRRHERAIAAVPLNQRLKQAFAVTKKAQGLVAALCGLSQRQMSYMVHTGSQPNYDTAIAVAAALEVHPDVLWTVQGDPTRYELVRRGRWRRFALRYGFPTTAAMIDEAVECYIDETEAADGRPEPTGGRMADYPPLAVVPVSTLDDLLGVRRRRRPKGRA